MNYNLIAYALDFSSFLLEKMKKDSDKISQIILFGSITRGQEEKESDIDLFIDITDKNIEKRINEIKNQFFESVKTKKYWVPLGIKNEINLSIGKLNEWTELQRSIIANGIVIYGKYKEKPETDAFYLFVVSPGKDRNKNLSVWREMYGYSQKINKKTYIKEGLIKEFGGKKLARGVFIIPIEHAQKISDFLRKKSFNFQLIPFWSEKE